MPRNENERRATEAGRLLAKAYKNDSRGVVKEDVIDALTDILHLCSAKKIDFEDTLRISKGHFEEERGK